MTEIDVTWNLDVAGAQQLEDSIADLSGQVVINLADTAFVASSGLRVLLKHAQRLSDDGGALVVCGANPTVAEVFQISGFDTIIDSYDGIEEARAALGND